MTELTTEVISTKIFEIRGQKVMLDRDLAALYQVKTKVLNQAVKRNIERFPSEKYMFQLTKDELYSLRSQIVTTNISSKSRTLPHVFTEHGTIQLSAVLNSKIAIKVNHIVIDAFIDLRKQINTNPSYTELKEQLNRLERQIINVEDMFKLQQRIDTNSQDQKITQLSERVGKLTQIMNEFQDNNLIIKRPEEGGGIG
jgi:hypothetical protein